MATVGTIHKCKYRVVRGLDKNGQVKWECTICKERS